MLVTYDNVKEVHAHCIEQVILNNYYTDIANQLLEQFGEPETPEEIVLFWQRFWESLPDSKSIRRDPFYLICDIAENYMNPHFFGDEDE